GYYGEHFLQTHSQNSSSKEKIFLRASRFRLRERGEKSLREFPRCLAVSSSARSARLFSSDPVFVAGSFLHAL
ncbi:hypothetical protein, partial [uncultured Pyramidobacter sp.]|uniref:hypothetical protein n=1 Tax=uncultured Pyramidobacter sp. TaxID=1623495 RepID=UPI00258C37E8